MHSSERQLFAVVMAGGAGTRFWPLSRRTRPKQLLPLLGRRSLLAMTVERLAPLVPPERTWVVTVAEVADAVRAELPKLPAANILVEPVGRDTAACVGWVVWRLAASCADASMVVLPSDHVITDGAALCHALRVAARTAEERGGLVTLGVRPTRPETGYGYLEFGEEFALIDGLRVHRVQRFIEKPGAVRAAEFVASGCHRWNAGIFAWTVGAMQAAIRTHLPELATGLDALEAHAAAKGEADALAVHYPALPRISIDFGVMEKADRVWGVAVEFAWSDVGSWPGLEEVVAASADNVAIGDVVALDTRRSVLVTDGPLVATIGADDLVVVATRDAVLVARKSDAQKVKELVEVLRKTGRTDVL